MIRYKVYLAGLITGLSYGESVNWRKDAANEFYSSPILTLSPMRSKPELSEYAIIGKTFELKDSVQNSLCCSRGIITRDYNDVKNCDAILVNLQDESKISIGTVMEIAWAKAFQIPVVAIVSEKDELYNHPMINECIGFRTKSLEDACEIIKTLLP